MNLALADVMVDEHPQVPEKPKRLAIYEEHRVEPEKLLGVGPNSGALCALAGCDDHTESRGLCAKHYRYWLRNGTEALNRHMKRVPKTREEARQLLYVRAIELADAENYEKAAALLEEAARLFGDPKLRKAYDKRREALYSAKRRAEGKATPWANSRAQGHKERFIEEHGEEAWREHKRKQHENHKARFIAKHGEQAWRDKVNAASLRHYHKKKKAERDAESPAAHGA
jgi:hypothetical protein